MFFQQNLTGGIPHAMWKKMNRKIFILVDLKTTTNLFLVKHERRKSRGIIFYLTGLNSVRWGTTFYNIWNIGPGYRNYKIEKNNHHQQFCTWDFSRCGEIQLRLSTFPHTLKNPLPNNIKWKAFLKIYEKNLKSNERFKESLKSP